jgi:hypothetical protein
VPILLVDAVRVAYVDCRLQAPVGRPWPSAALTGQLKQVTTAIAPELPEAALARTMIGWTQLFGMISFELTGQFVGSAEPADEFFEYATAEIAAFVGLP